MKSLRLLGVILIFIIGTSGGRMQIFPKTALGTYNGSQKSYETFQITLDEHGNGSFRVIISQHTPPAVVDEHKFVGKMSSGTIFCIEPAPAHYPKCFELGRNQITAVDSKGKAVFKMTKYEE